MGGVTQRRSLTRDHCAIKFPNNFYLRTQISSLVPLFPYNAISKIVVNHHMQVRLYPTITDWWLDVVEQGSSFYGIMGFVTSLLDQINLSTCT
jgi:hypothetical protein